VTGFLGKVVLEELLCRRGEFRLERVYVVIRRNGSRTAQERFAHEVVTSPCFAKLPSDWTRLVDVVEADLEHPGLALNGHGADLERSVTHVIHAAASVSFDLPIREAAQANVVAALNVLELAKRCPRLERMVDVSTAYVTPHANGAAQAVEERLAPLPRPAAEILGDIQRHATSERRLLHESGHPNTYTLTKCIAEHLLLERRGHVPLTIVRPSVISASLHHPFPGWIDSTAAFGAFVLMLGLGHLRAVVGHGQSKLDLVPVDEVAARVLAACMAADAPAAGIRHATAGSALSPTLMECWDAISEYFGVNRVQRRPNLAYLGPRKLRFLMADALHHRLPTTMASLGGRDLRRKARSLRSRLAMLNRAFPYFTSNSFAFHSSDPLGDGFEPKAYVRLVCQGMHRHILRQDRRQWILAGAKQGWHGGDWSWSFRQPHGNLWIRWASLVVTRVLRRTHDRITVDLPSFEAARKAVPEGSALVIVATHRSYLDFVLVSLLAFSRPDLRIAIPHIAATMEFGKIPVLGRVLGSMHAFYLRRGSGKEDPELTRRIHQFVGEGKTLEFFIEGTRSRSREFLEPKRGLLRALQATGRPVAILPVGLSYDRVPEEATFAAELAGAPKPRMRLSSLVGWLWRVNRRKVALGRAHIACGAPVLLDAGSDVVEVSQEVMQRLREATVTTTFHIDAYLRHAQLPGMDATELRRQIERRGGRVLESALAVPDDLDPTIAATFRHQFAHLFDSEPLLAERPAQAETGHLHEVVPGPARAGR
ncbi:MAG TPA: SDR family oxidoreductase, partial [Candidatus Thermoplasmatota archaeon]|nr:SDR family oxidoreductase [Candidatus Thermoplasmatota archaeon]